MSRLGSHEERFVLNGTANGSTPEGAVAIDEGVDLDFELTAQGIASARFVKSLRGYNRDDVDAFLRGVADDYQRIVAELRDARQAQAERAALQELASPPLSVAEHVNGHDTVSPLPPHEGPNPSASGLPVAELLNGNGAVKLTSKNYAASVSDVRALLLDAEEEAWRIRDDAETAFDRDHAEVSQMLTDLHERSTRIRSAVSRNVEASPNQADGVLHLPRAAEDMLREADAIAQDVILRTRQRRRAMYRHLIRGETRARQVIEQAHREACRMLRDGAES